MKNRMRELRSFGSVRDEGRKVLVYSEFRCALLCLVVPNATGATRILSIESKLNFRLLPTNQGVGGSNPSGRANRSRRR